MSGYTFDEFVKMSEQVINQKLKDKKTSPLIHINQEGKGQVRRLFPVEWNESVRQLMELN